MRQRGADLTALLIALQLGRVALPFGGAQVGGLAVSRPKRDAHADHEAGTVVTVAHTPGTGLHLESGREFGGAQIDIGRRHRHFVGGEKHRVGVLGVRRPSQGCERRRHKLGRIAQQTAQDFLQLVPTLLQFGARQFNARSFRINGGEIAHAATVGCDATSEALAFGRRERQLRGQEAILLL